MRWVPAAVWAAVILVATSLPRPERFVPPVFPGADKIVHFALYAVLAFLTRLALPPGAVRPALGATAIGLAAFAAADEWHQRFIPGRSMDAGDWAADVAGAAAGLMIGQSARRRREHST